MIAAWVQHQRGLGTPVRDIHADQVAALAQGTLADWIAAVLAFLDPDLAEDDRLRAAVGAQATELAALAR